MIKNQFSLKNNLAKISQTEKISWKITEKLKKIIMRIEA